MAELGEDTSNATLVTLFEKFVQRVFEDLGRATRWFFMVQEEDVNTVASTEEYSISTDAAFITSARIDPTDDPVEYITRDELIRRGVDMDETGRPKFFYHSGFDSATLKSKISFWPIPDDVYKVELHEIQQPKTLASGDVVPVPHEFDSVLYEGVLAMAYRHENMLDLYDRTWTGYQVEKERLRRRYAHQPNHYRRMQVRDINTSDPMAPVRFDPSHFNNL